MMKKLLQKRLKNEKGLTLVELLAVIVILGIIAAIAIPSIGGIIDNTRIKASKADAINAIEAAKLYFVENDDKTEVTLVTLKTEGYMKDLGTLVEGTGSDAGKVFKGASGSAVNITAKSQVNGKTIQYTTATVQQINSSKNSLTVPAN